jgi:hypothetical protein
MTIPNGNLAVSDNWVGGVQMQSGVVQSISRYGTSPTPTGLWSLSQGILTGQGANNVEMSFTIAASSSLIVSLVGANGETNTLNQLLSNFVFTCVKSVEIILTTPPASGISLTFGPQGGTQPAQLWFGGVTAAAIVSVQDQFCNRDRSTGWPITGTTANLILKNPSAVSVSGWMRVLGY